MLDGYDHAVVVGHGIIVYKDGAIAATVLISLGRILLGEIKALSLVGGGGTWRSRSAGRLSGWTCQNDASASSASCTPDSGNVDGWADGCTRRHMDSVAGDVLHL